MEANLPGTPIRKRMTEIGDGGTFSPLRRLSSMATNTSTPLQQSIVNDDEAERSNRRQHVVQQKRMSVTSSSINSEGSELSGKDLQDHFETCLKMFTENKINMQNAWSLHIIDFMRSVLLNKGPDTLQLASTTLDVSARVYGLRVDDVHSQMLKLTDMLSRFKPPKETEDTTEDMDVDGETDQHTKSKRKRRLGNEGTKTTVVSNEDAINCEVKIQNPDIQTATSDENKLMTVSAYKVPKKYNLTLDAGDILAFLPAKKLKLGDNSVEVSFPQTLGQLGCSDISDLMMEDWSPDNDNSFQQSQLPSNSLVYDQEGHPLPNLDNVDNDNFDHVPAPDPINVSDEENEAQSQLFATEVIQIRDLRPVTTSFDLEYCYRPTPCMNENNAGMSIVWAGPSHWKLKCLRQSTASTNPAAKQVQKRHHSKKLTVLPVGFDDSISELEEIAKKRMKIKTTTMSHQQCTFPKNINDSKDSIRSLMLKPLFAQREKNVVKLEHSMADLNVSTYQPNNFNDSEYCSQSAADDGWVGNANDAEEELIEAPRLVQKSNILYAMQAKKIDMKKLKTVIWNEFTKNENNNGNILKGPVRFSEIYSKIPGKLNEDMATELSLPIALVALLHLATEKSLKLVSVDNLRDVLIEQD